MSDERQNVARNEYLGYSTGFDRDEPFPVPYCIADESAVYDIVESQESRRRNNYL